MQQRAYPGLQLSIIEPTHCKWELPLEPFDQFAVGSRELNRTNASLRSRNQHAPQWRIGERVANARRDCSPPILVESHPKLRCGPLIEPAAGPVSSVIHGSRNGIP